MSADHAVISALEREFPGWHVWTVHKVVGGTTWCARPHKDLRAVINAGSAQELAEAIVGAEAGQ